MIVGCVRMVCYGWIVVRGLATGFIRGAMWSGYGRVGKSELFLAHDF